MDAGLVTIVAAALAGSALSEAARYFLNRSSSEFSLFQDAWREEVKHLHSEVNYLSEVIRALSNEVERLGGNPLSEIPPRPDR